MRKPGSRLCAIALTLAVSGVTPIQAKPAKAVRGGHQERLPPSRNGEPRRGYVTERLDVPLRAGQGSQSKLLKRLAAGAPLTILGQDARAGLTQVALPSGEKGWLPSEFVVTTPPENPVSGAPATRPEKSPQQLQAEVQQLSSELAAVRQASANALQIQTERDKLQESVITLERELESLRREKSALDGEYRQDWFLIGAGVLGAGLLLGAFLPRLAWRKKSSWDSF